MYLNSEHPRSPSLHPAPLCSHSLVTRADTGPAFTVHFLATVHGGPVLSEKPPGSPQSSLLWLPKSWYKPALGSPAFLQSHSSPLSARVSSQPPLLSSHPAPCTATRAPHRCTPHPGCDYTSLVTLATVHQAARSGDLQGHPESPSTHISAFSSLRSPCLAKGAHFYSQDMAVAPSHTGTGTSLVTVIISFLI